MTIYDSGYHPGGFLTHSNVTPGPPRDAGVKGGAKWRNSTKLGLKPPLCTSLHIILETLGDMTQLWVLHALHAEHMWQEPMIKISKWYCGFSQSTGARHGKTMKMKGQVSQKRLRPESMAVHGRVKTQVTQDRKQNLVYVMVCSKCRFNHDNRMIRLENYISLDGFMENPIEFWMRTSELGLPLVQETSTFHIII